MTKILIVDDSPIDGLLLREYLKRSGFNSSDILQVNTGIEAITLYKVNPSDFRFILMDVRLEGELDGYQTTQKLMDISPIPIIMQSAQYHPEHPEVGYCGYLPKPYRKEQLTNLLQTLNLM
jgi:CheY-like chemotaxis protein